ncbi:MAG: nitrogenase [Candidatus Schekmanbacteria bacterium]|nr:nitrogenase [Candidatus Schekmanbacteria bacterium]
MSEKRCVTINPPKMCQPMGAIYAYLGVHACVPLVHGSQGCATYPRYNLCRHFREPAELATSSLTEDAAVYGGRKNLIEAIRNVHARMHPELIGVLTTCLSETIGDDVKSIIRECEEELDGIPVITASTPSYVGTHLTGYDNALKSMLETLAAKGNPNGKINIVTGMINPGDINEIKHILQVMGVSGIFLTDVSQTMNSPIKFPKPHYPEGGTTLAEIGDAVNSLSTITLSAACGTASAKLLERKFNVPAALGAMPIGVKNADAFIQNIARFTGKPIPAELERERGLLLDALVDTHHYLYGKKAAIFGDPDMVAAIVRFCAEAGMKPSAACTATPHPNFAPQIKAVADEYNCKIEILEGSDLFALQEVMKKEPVHVLLGNSKGKDLANDENVPIVRVGFPVYDRVGAFRYPIIGYNGSIYLLDQIVNAILEHKYDQQKLHQ